MSRLKEENKEENIEFSWGRKKGVGGPNKDVHFYESFTYDGVEYFLYDCVYMWRDDDPEPDIGKLVKIWEAASHKKMVKVVWFFRPIELKNWLEDVKPLKNEIFLASGEGKGLFNLNPLETICGKCNVLCTSMDERNLQPSGEELRMADYIFSRSFDVGRCKISDKFADSIAGHEVEHFFNVKKDHKISGRSLVKANFKEGTGLSSSSSKFEVATAGRVVKDGQPVRSTNPAEKEPKIAAANYGKPDCFSDEKTTLRPKTLTDKDGTGAMKISCNQLDERERVKYSVDLSSASVSDVPPLKISCNQLDERERVKYSVDLSSASVSDVPPLKRRKLQSTPVGFKEDRAKLTDHKEKLPSAKVSVSEKRGLPKGVIFDQKANQIDIPLDGFDQYDKGVKTGSEILEVTRRPDADTSKWFKQQSWEERMQRAHENGSLVLLENLDPSYTSSEVEDIVWSALKMKASAKMIQRSTFSSPRYGQAFVIFKTKDEALFVMSELNKKCLMLVGGRPVVGSRGTLRGPDNPSKFVGHLVIDKLRYQKQREEMRNAVSTSHYSQPNTIEYEMAIEWLALQEKSNLWWDALNKKQAKEAEDLRILLKTDLNE